MPPKEKISSLVQAAQSGDEFSFATLVRSYQDLAVAYATSILGDYHLAEDAAQEAFVDAYRALPSLREPAAFGSWFRTVLFKHCDRLKRRKRLPIIRFEDAWDLASSEPSPHDILVAKETEQTVNAAVAALPEAERSVALLYYMGEHSHAAIAEFLNITPNAVKTRLYSARQRLRKPMADEVKESLQAVKPSRDSQFADKVQRMIQPDVLKKKEPLVWSTGMGTDVWKMFCAAITGELRTLKRLLKKDPSLVRGAYGYKKALTFAVQENQLEVARYLIEQGADPIDSGTPDSLLDIARDRGYAEMQALLEAAITGTTGESPRGEAIAAAIRERDLLKVRRLLDESPELIHAVDERTNAPIHWATMTRQLDMIDEVLARGADIEAQRGDGARPIQLTNGDYHYRGWRDVPPEVTTTHEEVFQHLRSRGAYVDIGMASAKGDLERVRELLDRDPSLANRVSDYGSYYLGCGAPIKNAAAQGHIEVVRLLLERGADPNLPEEGIAPRGHALYSAVANRHYDIAKLLLEHGAYPNVDVESSADTLSRAIMNHDQPMIDLLCSYGAARNVDILAYYNDLQTAAAVFAANPKLADDPGAFGSAGDAFMELMLRYQPDLPQRVTVTKSPQMTKRLFQMGMDPSRPDWLRITPLHRFAEMGDVENAALFLDHGADIDARDEQINSTPLGWAAKFGKPLMVEYLLKRGARPLPDDPEWATPLAWATRRGHDRVAQILKQFERDGSLPVHSREEFETLADDLVNAYNTGDVEAAQRVTDYFQFDRSVRWEKLRGRVQGRLNQREVPEAEDRIGEVTAREVVAQMHGYENWDALLSEY